MQKKHHAKVQQVVHHKITSGSEQPVHVMIENPINLRKSILSSALDVTRLQKTYAELKEIREAKVSLIDIFSSIHTDLKHIIKGLEKGDLPKLTIKEADEETYEEVKVTEHIEKKPVAEKVGNSEIDALKAELEAIEKKLGNI